MEYWMLIKWNSIDLCWWNSLHGRRVKLELTICKPLVKVQWKLSCVCQWEPCMVSRGLVSLSWQTYYWHLLKHLCLSGGSWETLNLGTPLFILYESFSLLSGFKWVKKNVPFALLVKKRQSWRLNRLNILFYRMHSSARITESSKFNLLCH